VFTFTPGEKSETDGKDRGSLYIVAELENSLPKNSSFLQSLAGIIQKEYYAEQEAAVTSSGRKKAQKPVAPETALKSALKRANDFLESESKKGNIDWLGNLHFAVLAFVPSIGGANLYFTKIGTTKLWMARKGSLVDVGKNLESAKSAKMFGSVVSGKVLPSDRVFALPQDLFDIFVKQDLLQRVTELAEEKQFQKLFKTKEKELSLASGVLFYVLMEAEEEQRPPEAKEEKQERKLPQLPNLSLKALPRPKLEFRQLADALPAAPILRMPKINMQKLSLLSGLSVQRKKLFLFVILAGILALGFVFFSGREQPSDNIQADLDKARSLQIQAESALILKDERRVNELLQEVWAIVSPHNESEFDSIKKDVRNQLYAMYKVEEVAVSEVPLDEEVSYAVPFFDTAVDQLGGSVSYGSNVYVFDAKNGDIMKTQSPVTESSVFTPWLEELSAKKPIGMKSMAIDGSIWALMNNGDIQRYYKGRYEETISPEIFPVFQQPTLLKTNARLPYLYILDASEMRLVLMTKFGDIVQQYKSDAFSQVTDFAVSEDGTALYLSGGQRVYKITAAPFE
jgi:hypothetical protein